MVITNTNTLNKQMTVAEVSDAKAGETVLITIK